MGKSLFCIGAVNIDHVYSVPRFLKINESACCEAYHWNWGGKGLNQTVALRKAGGNPTFYAKVGKIDYLELYNFLGVNGVSCDKIIPIKSPTNHGIIQIDHQGNTVILGCPNPEVNYSEEEVDAIIAEHSSGDVLYLQNEIPAIPYIIAKARSAGMQIILNASPLENWELLPLDKVNWLILNEAEATVISGITTPEQSICILYEKFGCNVLVTLGERGSICVCEGKRYEQSSIPAKVVDTSCAGDTFLGFFISLISEGRKIEDAMYFASKAASIVVSQIGAAETIPIRADVVDQ